MAVCASIPWHCSVPTCLILIWGYQYLIALLFRVKVMPTMDVACFFGNDKATVNFMSATVIDRMDFQKSKDHFLKLMKMKPKITYCIQEILGDYYWKPTNPEETIHYCFQRIPTEIKTQRDIEQLVEEDMNKLMPMDKPQWRMYFQENYLEDKSLVIYKQHHSLSDGVSCISFHLAHGEGYDLSSLIAIKKVPFIQRMILRLSFPLYVPGIIIKQFLVKQDINPLNDGVKNLSGKKRVGTTSDLLFKDIKAAAKKQGVTINDLVTAAVATAVKQYFKLRGDNNTNKINIVIPANIRF